MRNRVLLMAGTASVLGACLVLMGPCPILVVQVNRELVPAELDLVERINRGDDLNEIKSMIELDPESATKPNMNGDYPLHAAARHNRVDVLKLILETGADVNQKSLSFPHHTPLHVAVSEGKVDIAKLLLESGAKLDATDIAGLTVRDYLPPDDAAMRELLEEHERKTKIQD